MYAGQLRPVDVYKTVPQAYSAVAVYTGDDKMTIEWQALKNDGTDLHDEIHKAMANAEAALGSVTTVKKLIDVWPEVEEFVPEWAKQETSYSVPALPISDLNASFGLKTKKAA